MRTLTELEMSVAAGVVDPIPIPYEPPCMPKPDPIWTRMILELMYPRKVAITDR